MIIEIKINGEIVRVLDENAIKLLEYNNPSAEIGNIVTNAINNSVSQLISVSTQALQTDWIPIIRKDYNTMPTKDNDIAALIYSQEKYKNFDQRNGIGE
jgi:hypothetical protein